MEAESKKDLYAKAKRYSIPGRSKMSKAELISAIRKKQREFGNRFAKRA